jgi:hypothetical protein
MQVSEPQPDPKKRSFTARGFLPQRDAILRYKWLESEKAGQDIGFEKALLGWMLDHPGGAQRLREDGMN